MKSTGNRGERGSINASCQASALGPMIGSVALLSRLGTSCSCRSSRSLSAQSSPELTASRHLERPLIRIQLGASWWTPAHTRHLCYTKGVS